MTSILTKFASRKLLVALLSAGTAFATGHIDQAVAIVITYVLGQSVADAAKPVIDVLLSKDTGTLARLKAKLDEADGVERK